VIRAWLTVIWNSLAVAVIAVAAQVGVAGALGIVRWTDSSVNAWSVLLTWVAFIYIVAVVGGAAAGRRVLRRPGHPDGALGRVLAAFLAGVGATGATGLALLLATSTAPGTGQAAAPVTSGSPYPELVVASTAGAGVVVGIALALIAGAIPAAAVGLRATVAWVWLVGLGVTVAGYFSHRPYPAPRLGVVDAPALVTPAWWNGPNLMVALAVLFGVAVAGIARWSGAGRVGVGFSGLAGPAAVAAAYLIAWPGMGDARPAQLDSYRAAVISVGAGLLGSAVVALFPMPSRSKPVPLRPTTRSPAMLVPVQPSATHTIDDDTTWALATQHRAPDPGIMGQPRNPYEEDYSQWLRDLGHSSDPPTQEIQPRGVSS
jgi:hypothetical protein